MKYLTTSLVILLGLMSNTARADEHTVDDGNYQQRFLKAAAYRLYKEECGSCHLAYPPGLLLGDSWQYIMQGLGQHFGDNAELDTKTRRQLTDYLIQFSADRAERKHFNSPPVRITRLGWFLQVHEELPPRLIKDNNKVRSLSNCNACHRWAEQAAFVEQGPINIPGYGRWSD